MDNNKNKQFFWQVKDFMTKNNNPAPKPKQNSLLNTVTNVMNSSKNVGTPNIYEARNGIVNGSSQVKNSVSNVLNTVKNSNDKQKASCAGYSNNITSNPFNLFKK
jgi:hypothetical protein